MTIQNPYLEGNFAPVKDEITADKLPIIGQLPPELNGMYVRNGPNPQFTPIGHYHWFDGDGMLHAVRLQDGQATYFNRYVEPRALQIERQQGKAMWVGLLGNVTHNMRHFLRYGMLTKNSANTALVFHAGRLLALWELGPPHQVSQKELTTIGEYTYNGKWSGSFTAHPKVDPVTGEMMCFGYNLFRPPYVQYGVISAAGEIQRIEPIHLPMPVIMHDLAITKHYTIFMDLPLVFSRKRAMQFRQPIYFDAKQTARFGIMPRHGTQHDLRWFEVQPCYVFHTLNAYEQGNEVIVVGCRMENTNLLLDYPPSEQPYLYRWRFNLKSKRVQEERLSDISVGFPRTNESYIGSPTRYGYTSQQAPQTEAWFAKALVKHDLHTGEHESYYFGDGRTGGEAVFAPRPNGSAEDDGWLLTYVYDAEQDKSELLILNAQDISGKPAARILLPQRVPYGFHGTWLDESVFGSR